MDKISQESIERLLIDLLELKTEKGFRTNITPQYAFSKEFLQLLELPEVQYYGLTRCNL